MKPRGHQRSKSETAARAWDERDAVRFMVHDQGATVVSVARQYGTTPGTITRIIDSFPRVGNTTKRYDTADIQAAVAEHGTYVAAAEALGCTIETVSRHCGSRTPAPPTLTLAEIRERYESSGESLRTIAAAAGTGYDTIRRRLHLLGVEVRPRGGADRANDLAHPTLKRHRLAVCRLYELGASQHLLATSFGVSKPAVARFVRREGLPPRPAACTTTVRQRQALAELARNVAAGRVRLVDDSFVLTSPQTRTTSQEAVRP